MTYLRNIIRGVGILTLLAVLVPIHGVSNAQQAGQALEITPTVINLEADPGQVIEDTQIKIRNITDQTLVVRAQYNDFVAGDEEDGTPRLLLDEDENAEPSPYTIKDWLQTIPEVTLEANEQKVINVTLNVPENASPGGHYGVIRFTGTPPEVDSSAVSLSASIGSLILVRVSGDVSEQANIAELYTSKDGEKRSMFEYGPVTINTRFENSGNVHVQPSGTVTVRDMFGRTVESYNFNENKGNVLPQSIRRFENVLEKELLFGKFTVQADIVYGSDNSIVSSSTSFWVIPYKLIALGVAVLIGLIIGLKQYNRFIIRQSEKGRGNGKDSSKKK